MIRLTHAGLKGCFAKTSLENRRRHYARRHFVHLKRFVHPELVSWMRQEMKKARFYERKDGKIAKESTMSQNAAYNAMQFLSNQKPFLEFVESLTGRKPKSFVGRVYRFEPNKGHYDSWHNDVYKKRPRLAAMSVNLSERPYRGGVLEIRRKKNRRIIGRVHNVGPGDCVLFHISPDLEHRVTPVKGRAPRTVFTGWFSATEHGWTSFIDDRRHSKNGR